MRSSINTGPIKVYSTDSETQVKRLYQRPRAFMEYFIPRRYTYATKLLDTADLAEAIRAIGFPL